MKHAEPLGERAVRLGLASQEAVASALAEQRTRSEKGAKAPIGSLLVDMGLLAPTDLVRLLADSPLSGFHLGEDAVRLAAQLPGMMQEGRRTVLVTAPRTGQGASTVCSQVALALSLMGAGSALVVDANLHAPAQADKFRVRSQPGLVEAVRDPHRVDECIASSGLRGLDVLPAGAVTGDALSAIISPSCHQLLLELRRRYGWIMLDLPPMLEHPEAALLAPSADGVLVVARAGSATRSDLNEMTRAIAGLGVRHLGVVLSRTGAVHARRDP